MEEAAPIYMATTGQMPSGMYSSINANTRNEGADYRAETAAVTKAVEGARRMWTTTFNSGNTPTPESVQAFKQDAIAGASGVKSPDMIQRLNDNLDALIKAQLAIGASGTWAGQDGCGARFCGGLPGHGSLQDADAPGGQSVQASPDGAR